MKMTMNLNTTEATEVLDAMHNAALESGEEIDITVLSKVVDAALDAMGIAVSITEEDEDEDEDERCDAAADCAFCKSKDEDEDEDEAEEAEAEAEDEDDNGDEKENDIDTVLNEVAKRILTLPNGRRVIRESDAMKVTRAIRRCIEELDPSLSNDLKLTVFKDTWEFFAKTTHLDEVAMGE